MIFTFALLDQFAQENGTRRFTFAVSICSVRRSNGIRGMGPPSSAAFHHQLNPSFALGWQRSGWLRLWAGQPDIGIGHFETALRLNPLQERADHYLGIGMGHFFARRFEQAVATLLLSLQEAPVWVPTHRFLASCHAHMGRLAEARQTIRRLRELTNDVVPSATHWRNPEHRELFLSGLRLAMGQPT